MSKCDVTRSKQYRTVTLHRWTRYLEYTMFSHRNGSKPIQLTKREWASSKYAPDQSAHPQAGSTC